MNKEVAESIGHSMIRLKKRIDNTGVYELFTQHPQEHSMTYVQHFWKTMTLSIKTGIGSICLMVHAYFPFMCKKTAENIIAELQEDTAE
jgi:hypothetical protein